MPTDTRNPQTHDVPARRQNTLEVVPNGENWIACHDMLGIRRRCVPWKFFSSVQWSFGLR